MTSLLVALIILGLSLVACLLLDAARALRGRS